MRTSILGQQESGVSHPIGGMDADPAVRKEPSPYPLNPSQIKGYLAPDFPWRNLVYDELLKQGATTEADDFLWCESNFRGIEVCSEDITHSRAIPITCHKRYCPHCARRDAARLVAAHTPQIKAIVDEAENKSYRLRRIELTTAIDIFDPDIEEKMQAAIDAVNLVFDHYCGRDLSEAQRHRWSERSHKGYTGEGLIFSVEFGEDGKKLHFHCLFFGRYIEKYHLSEVWQACSGYSITWVQHVSKTEGGIREALKYVTKDIKPKTDPQTGEILGTLPDPKLTARIAKVLRGSRRVFCRGAFRGLEADITEPGEDLGETICKTCGGSAELVNLDFWSSTLYAKFAAALHRQLDLKLGNKSSTPTEDDVGPPVFGVDLPSKNSSQEALETLNTFIEKWNQETEEAKRGKKQ